MYNPTEQLLLNLGKLALPLLISLALTFSAKSHIEKCIPQGKKFSGIEFGIFNGLFGPYISIAWVLPIILGLNKKVNAITDPTYAASCKKQMSLFLWIYLGFMIAASVFFTFFLVR